MDCNIIKPTTLLSKAISIIALYSKSHKQYDIMNASHNNVYSPYCTQMNRRAAPGDVPHPGDAGCVVAGDDDLLVNCKGCCAGNRGWCHGGGHKSGLGSGWIPGGHSNDGCSCHSDHECSWITKKSTQHKISSLKWFVTVSGEHVHLISVHFAAAMH